MEIKEYFVVREESTNELIAHINRKISAGWQPFGSLQVHSFKYDDVQVGNDTLVIEYFQSMVKSK